jgi:anti-sigma regulatory factor (Ser/Thr protein kinase)
MRKRRKLRLRAVLESIPQAIDCVGASARAMGFGEKQVHQIQMAVDEACANVVEHAYADMLPGDMEVECRCEGRDFVVLIRDWGCAFEPDGVRQPDIDAPLEERELGGLGLYLIRRTMDRAEFTFDPQRGNELVMVKRLVS